MPSKLSEREKQALLRKYESGISKDARNYKSVSKEDYLKQTDRNYKDGDRN